MEEEKFKPAEQERGDWIILLENHMRVVEESRKQIELEHQRLLQLQIESYRTLKQAFVTGKAKFPHAGNLTQGYVGKFQEIVRNFFVPNPPPEHIARIQALEEKIKQDQKEISELKEKQHNLIKHSLALFDRHKAQSDGLLQQLEKEKIVNAVHLHQCQILFENANENVEKLKEEDAKTVPNFELCNDYVIDAGKFYQAGYGSIIALLDQQPALKGMQVNGNINIDKANIVAGGHAHIGSDITINLSCQTAKKELESLLKSKQEAFDNTKVQHDTLQQCYQKRLKELASSQGELKQQQEDLQRREQLLSDQLAKIQQEAESAKAEAEQAKQQVESMQQRIAQLEADSAAKIAKVKQQGSQNTPAEAASTRGLMHNPRGVAGNNPAPAAGSDMPPQRVAQLKAGSAAEIVKVKQQGSQSTPAEAASARGLMPNPREVAGNNPAPAAGLSMRQRIAQWEANSAKEVVKPK